MTGPERENPRSFSEVKLWHFSGVSFTPSTYKNASWNQKRFTKGIMAKCFDDAYAAFRERWPDHRIEGVSIETYRVDVIVDNPVAEAMAERLLK